MGRAQEIACRRLRTRSYISSSSSCLCHRIGRGAARITGRKCSRHSIISSSSSNNNSKGNSSNSSNSISSLNCANITRTGRRRCHWSRRSPGRCQRKHAYMRARRSSCIRRGHSPHRRLSPRRHPRRGTRTPIHTRARTTPTTRCTRMHTHNSIPRTPAPSPSRLPTCMASLFRLCTRSPRAHRTRSRTIPSASHTPPTDRTPPHSPRPRVRRCSRCRSPRRSTRPRCRPRMRTR